METVGSKISPLVLNPGKEFLNQNSDHSPGLIMVCCRPYNADESKAVLPGKQNINICVITW
jgi:hypothetical protein